MTTSAVDSVQPWTAVDVEELVVELLAELLEEEPVAYRRRLDSDGWLMPVDSLDLFDVLQKFRQITGLTLPVRRLRRRTMRSVRLFAEFVEQECTS